MFVDDIVLISDYAADYDLAFCKDKSKIMLVDKEKVVPCKWHLSGFDLSEVGHYD